MTAKVPRIIVDASVARACGKPTSGAPSPAPESVAALARLQARALPVVFNRELFEEWSKHAGHYAMKWLGEMKGRKLFSFVSACHWPLEGAVISSAAERSKKGGREVAKDAHLVSLAMETERRVISLDDKQRGYLARCCEDVPALLTLHWVSPTAPLLMPWLDAGAPEDARLCVGYEVT